jgi:hypothetical protein
VIEMAQSSQHYSQQSSTDAFVYKTLFSVSGISSNKHFEIIGNLLANKNRIDQIFTMPDTKCLQIENQNGEFISVINKNDILHLSSDSHDTNFNMIIEKIKNKEQLNALSLFFKSKNIVKDINSLINIEDNLCMAYTISNIKFYASRVNNYYVFSGVKP